MKYLSDWQFWIAWIIAAIVVGFVVKGFLK